MFRNDYARKRARAPDKFNKLYTLESFGWLFSPETQPSPTSHLTVACALVIGRTATILTTIPKSWPACSHPLHPNDPRQRNRPQVFSLSLPEPLLPVALLPRSDPAKPTTSSGLPVLVKQIPVKRSRPQNNPGSKKITKRQPNGVQKKTPTFFRCPKGNFLYHLCPLLWQLFAVRMASNRQNISVVEMPTNSHRLSAADTAT